LQFEFIPRCREQAGSTLRSNKQRGIQILSTGVLLPSSTFLEEIEAFRYIFIGRWRYPFNRALQFYCSVADTV